MSKHLPPFRWHDDTSDAVTATPHNPPPGPRAQTAAPSFPRVAGRVGALAVALGIGAAVVAMPGLAAADTTGSAGPAGSSASGSTPADLAKTPSRTSRSARGNAHAASGTQHDGAADPDDGNTKARGARRGALPAQPNRVACAPGHYCPTGASSALGSPTADQHSPPAAAVEAGTVTSASSVARGVGDQAPAPAGAPGSDTMNQGG